MTLPAPKGTAWAFGEVLTSTQMNSIRDSIPKAIDGDAGGTYDPTAALNIRSTTNGEGLGTVDVTDALNMKSGGVFTLEGTTAWVTVGSRSIAYLVSLADKVIYTSTVNGDATLSDFSFSGTPGIAANASSQSHVTQGHVASNNYQFASWIPVINGSTITRLDLRVDPAGANPAPSGLPRFRLVSFNSGMSQSNEISDVTDPGGGSYRDPHDISATGLSISVDTSSKIYGVLCAGEESGNAAVGLRFSTLKVTCTVTQLRY